MEESGLLSACPPERIAVLTGCSAGGQQAEETELIKLYTAQGRVHPFTVPRVMANNGASQISMRYGISGPVLTCSTACASSAHAIGQALHLIRSGVVDAAIAGGHEAALTYGFLKSWEAMRVVSPTRCRPFCDKRDGMTLGEGAAMLVLEERESALRRGAPVYAELCGFGMSSDAFHLTQPRPAGQAAAMRAALRDGLCDTAEVGYINAHGTGTEANDRAEAAAIHEVFRELGPEIAVSSTKGLHGHTIGAAGAIEALATALALRDGRLPASYGAAPVDSELRLRVLEQTTQASPRAALSNSFAFGGLNASLLFRRAD
jgi:3-oxoacyl-[acyl-carrier-protein] synthase II/nodulation protein E